jgi:hypothetical protein
VETKLNTQVAHLTGERTTDPNDKITPADRSKLLAALEQEAQHFAPCLAPTFQGMFTAPTQTTLTLVSGQPSATNHIMTS